MAEVLVPTFVAYIGTADLPKPKAHEYFVAMMENIKAQAFPDERWFYISQPGVEGTRIERIA